MVFTPVEYPPKEAPALIEQTQDRTWTPLYHHECSFPPEIFREVMGNLIKNPNLNSSYLFRADILLDMEYNEAFPACNLHPSMRITHFAGFDLKKVMVRKLIPRNPIVDAEMDQTCLFNERRSENETKSLIVYLPHVTSSQELPFYHPNVDGIAFFHSYSAQMESGMVSIHFSFFKSVPITPVLQRVGFHLLSTVHRHGQGCQAGYTKRVNHDAVLPQAVVQNTYTRLKMKYAKTLVTNWIEDTDPAKHVFEDLGIAAFLIELWKEMYAKNEFPGFVDIGCGNGLLVHILIEEGYSGSGFDARKRKSWNSYTPKVKENLKEMILIPALLQEGFDVNSNPSELKSPVPSEAKIHDGHFPPKTFIISNHADELTPWTPILATLSRCSFICIPCCSHDLTGSRFRAPAPKEKGASSSAYASLVAWVSQLASSCGWRVEKEMLRIPSTRNAALIGRARTVDFDDVDLKGILLGNGGGAGWEVNAMKLVKTKPRGH